MRDTEFTCPRCGSHFWGTAYHHGTDFDFSKATGHCHGGDGCRFWWPRTEDARYMRPVGPERPDIAEGVVYQERA